VVKPAERNHHEVPQILGEMFGTDEDDWFHTLDYLGIHHYIIDTLRKEVFTMTIKEARIQHGLTQTQLSQITGIPFRTIQNWEGGQRKCPDYVEKMVLNLLDQKFNQPDYQTILEEILDMLERDLKHLKTDEARNYVSNVISDLKDAIK
jgi:transcriptional regulator with XRE-family HTH domain